MASITCAKPSYMWPSRCSSSEKVPLLVAFLSPPPRFPPCSTTTKPTRALVGFLVASALLLGLRWTTMTSSSSSPLPSASSDFEFANLSCSLSQPDQHVQHVPNRPSLRYFDWVWSGEGRCESILKAIAYHSTNMTERDRMMKYREIEVSLPRFFRGLDHLFLQDVFHLESLPNEWFHFSNNQTRTFVDADLHMFNFGSFDNRNGDIVYDVNDFDQCLIGDYHIDLWRTTTSIVIHMDVNRILDPAVRSTILRSYALKYLHTLQSFVGNDDELRENALVKTRNAPAVINNQLQQVAFQWDRSMMLAEFSYLDEQGMRRLNLSRTDLEPVAASRCMELIHHFPEYLQSLGACSRQDHLNNWVSSFEMANVTREEYFTIKSIAARVGAGLGSLGEPRYYLLVEGASLSQFDDVLLDIKREPIPEWWMFVHEDIRRINRVWLSEAHRVCSGIHALGVHVDPDVGYMQMDDGAYIVRTRSPYKGAVDVDALTNPVDYQAFTDSLAYITAVSHARSDNDFDERVVPYSFEASLVRTVGDREEEFALSIEHFAVENAKRVQSDLECFTSKWKDYLV